MTLYSCAISTSKRKKKLLLSHTQLKARFVNVQLASGVIKGISVNKAFSTTITKMVVNHAPTI